VKRTILAFAALAACAARSGAGGVFAAAGGASAREPAAALEFLRYLKAPEAVKVIRAKGMDPG
jgi:hypothetical protein